LEDVLRADDAFFAQLGDGTTTDSYRLTPVAVIGLNSGIMLGAGQVRTFVVLAIWLEVSVPGVVMFFYCFFVDLGYGDFLK
jgi:hypothetical protein